MKYNFERNIMTNKITLWGFCLCLLALGGCVSDKSYMEEECENGICTSEQEYREVCTETPDGFSVCEDSTEPASNVNYTMASGHPETTAFHKPVPETIFLRLFRLA